MKSLTYDGPELTLLEETFGIYNFSFLRDLIQTEEFIERLESFSFYERSEKDQELIVGLVNYLKN